jgi:hypothetical protein
VSWFIPLWSGMVLYDFIHFQCIETRLMASHMVWPGECFILHLRKMCSAVVWWSFLHTSVTILWCCPSFLLHCWSFLPTCSICYWSWGYWVPQLLFLSHLFLCFWQFLLQYFGALLLGVYFYIIVISSWWIDPFYISCHFCLS